MRVRTSATCVRKLGFVAAKVVGIKGLCFLAGKSLWALEKVTYGRWKFVLWFDGIEDFLCEKASLTEKIDMLQLLALRRVFLVIARAADGIAFLPAFKNDPSIVIFILLATVDDAFFFDAALDVTERGFKIDYCHNVIVLYSDSSDGVPTLCRSLTE